MIIEYDDELEKIVWWYTYPGEKHSAELHELIEAYDRERERDERTDRKHGTTEEL